MKRFFLLVTALSVALFFGSAAVFAQHGGGGHGGGGGMGGGRGMGDSGGNSSRGMNNPNSTTRSGSSLGKQSPTDVLSKNSRLSSKLQSLLPAGTNLSQASSGFKNTGQFIAAVHVSNNLGVPFSDLKSKMVAGDSLGKAIQALDSNVNAKHEAKRAEKQSKSDLDQAASESD